MRISTSSLGSHEPAFRPISALDLSKNPKDCRQSYLSAKTASLTRVVEVCSSLTRTWWWSSRHINHIESASSSGSSIWGGEATLSCCPSTNRSPSIAANTFDATDRILEDTRILILFCTRNMTSPTGSTFLVSMSVVSVVASHAVSIVESVIGARQRPRSFTITWP